MTKKEVIKIVNNRIEYFKNGYERGFITNKEYDDMFYALSKVIEDINNSNQRRNNMELQLTNFEQSKSLNELSFPQLYEYTLDNKGNRKFKLAEYLVPYAFDINGNATVDRWNTNTYSCSPLCLVAKWLREEKNIYVDVIHHYTNNDYALWIGHEGEDEEFTGFTTYEEALSAGIDKAIEILKKK